MEIAMGVVRMDFKAAPGGFDEVRRTILHVSEAYAYRILGYRINVAHEIVSGGSTGGESDLFVVLRSAPVAVDFSNEGAIGFVSLGVQRMINHPSGLGVLVGSVGKNVVTAGQVQFMLFRSDTGWVPFVGDYLVPGVYLDAVQFTTSNDSPQSQLVWEVHYEQVRMSPTRLAALATARGWDADSSEDEFPLSTGGIGGQDLPMIG